MKIAIVGPVCKDEIIISGELTHRPGGVCYYSGNALSSLGVDVTVFGAFGKIDNFSEHLKGNMVHIKKDRP